MRRRLLIAVLVAIALEAALPLMLSWGAGVRGPETGTGAWAACSAAEHEVAQNVILFIGDGMGPGQLSAGRLARSGRLAMESMPVRTTVTTLSWGGNTTDSAAAATALATGHKTVNGSLAVLPDGTPVRTILEAARDAGWLVGLVTTCSIADATPAAFAVHVESRHEMRAIAAAIVRAKVDLLMGGGAADFLPTLFAKSKPPLELARESGYTVVQDRKGFDEASSLPLLGLFAMTNLDYEKDRDPSRQPGLAEMTAKAIGLLSSGGSKFLLVVEGGRIDHACHNNDAEALLGEMAAFDDAVARGLEFARGRKDTLVVVTADHETGHLSVGADQKLRFGCDAHTDVEVPLFAEGPGQEMFAGRLDNTDVPRIIAAAAGLTLGADRGGTRATERATVAGNGGQQAGPETCAQEPSGGQRPPATAQELISRPEQTGLQEPDSTATPVSTQEHSGPPEQVGAEKPVTTEESAMEPRTVPPPARLTIMTYNIHSGVGADLKLDLDRIADLVRDQGADIVGLCEVDQGTRRSGRVDQARYIAEKLGYHYVYGPNFTYDGGAFGNAILSRYPIVSSTNHPLPNMHFNEPRGLLEAQIDVGGGTLNVFVTHLDVEYADSRLAQARAVLEISSKAAGPKIVMGDLNASPTGSPEIAVLLRHFNDTHQVYRVLVDSAELVKEGLFARDYLKGGYTYDAYDPARRIDYILTSFDIKVAAEPGAARVPRTLASDHLPYIATIELPWPGRESGMTAGTGGTASTPLVAIFTSEANRAWYDDMRRDYEDDTNALVELVQELGLGLVMVSGDDLARLPLIAGRRATVLILSNARRMSPDQVQAVRDFVASGGRLLATGQASLKTEDERLGGFCGFQLADVLGVAFVGWQGVAPLHGAIVLPPAACRNGAVNGSTPNAIASDAVRRATSSAAVGTAPGVTPGSGQGVSAAGAAPYAARGTSPAESFAAESASGTLGQCSRDLDPGAALRALWSGIEAPLRLPESRGVVARCLPGAVALGAWADADGRPTHPDPFNVAVAVNGATIYIGADILSRDMLSDPAVRAFAGNAIRCLLQLQAASTGQ